MHRRLFCELSPLAYRISIKKSCVLRTLQDYTSGEHFAKKRADAPLPALIYRHNSLIRRTLGEVDPVLQENKAVNIRLANQKLNGILIRPGETFSFWQIVGKTTKRKGYRDGRILMRNHLLPGIGGGLCNLANTIHRVVLLSPMTVTEFHSHSDALAPDEGARVPFSSGTSVFYNNGDYRFRNDTDQTFQLLLWCDADNLYAELRCEHALPHSYRIVEEGHHFQKEGDSYYRVSKIYKETLDAVTGDVTARDLVLDNHSQVMYDPSLIPDVQLL